MTCVCGEVYSEKYTQVAPAADMEEEWQAVAVVFAACGTTNGIQTARVRDALLPQLVAYHDVYRTVSRELLQEWCKLQGYKTDATGMFNALQVTQECCLSTNHQHTHSKHNLVRTFCELIETGARRQRSPLLQHAKPRRQRTPQRRAALGLQHP